MTKPGLKKLVSEFGKFLQEKRVGGVAITTRSGKYSGTQGNLRYIAEQFGITPNEWLRIERGHIKSMENFFCTDKNILEFYRVYKHLFGSDQKVYAMLQNIKNAYRESIKEPVTLENKGDYEELKASN